MAAACQIIVVAYDLRMGMILNQDEDNENHVSYKKVNSNSLFSETEKDCRLFCNPVSCKGGDFLSADRE